MHKMFKRTAAFSLAAMIMMSQAAYAETITLATYPGTQDGNYITTQGPTGTETAGSNGYVQVGSHVDNSGYVNSGPGAVGNNGQQPEPGTGNTSSGTIYIDSINFANLDNITDSSIFQILDSNGTNSIQLALSEEISSADSRQR